MTEERQNSVASVDVVENTPITPTRRRGRSAAALLAEHEGRMATSTEQSIGEDGTPVLTTHRRPGTLVMYKPSERNGYVPRTVSASSLPILLRQGWKEFCPDCNAEHVNKKGEVSTDPNLCTAREPVKVRVCRVCSKRIYDNVRFGEQEDADDDPNVIRDDAYENTSPERRTEILLNLHYWMRHPQEAQMMGVPPLAGSLGRMVEDARPG
jgi:hypothetical protein